MMLNQAMLLLRRTGSSGLPLAMISALRSRWFLATVGLVALLGLLVTKDILVSLGLVGLVLLVALAFVAPVVNLVLIVFATAVIPFSVQNQLSGGARGLILSDVLLLAGLVRVVPGLLSGFRLERRQRTVLLALVVLLVVVTLQFLRGVGNGNDPSIAGAELRTILGFASFVIAFPVLAQKTARDQLFIGLLLTGLALGLWGLAQWILDIGFEGGFGVREGINFTTSGRGQLQGSMYAFPVAAVVGFAALIAGEVQRYSHRMLIAVVTVLNLACVLLTYERTFWVATAAALGFVTFRSGQKPRSRALLWGPAVVLVMLSAMSTLSPGTLGAARERLLSLGQYSTDGSVRYRVVESRHVLEAIGTHPAVGAGLGAELVWNRPWEGVPTRSYHYTHNGYLWVVWKLGLPAALLLFATLSAAIVWRPPPDAGPRGRSVHHGSQGALLLLMIASITFPSFNTYGITATMGLLLAVCASRSSPSSPSARQMTDHSPVTVG
jgi:hypothetical protein